MNHFLLSSILGTGTVLGASGSWAQTPTSNATSSGATSMRDSLAFPPASANGLTSGEARDVSDGKPTGGTIGTAGAMTGTATGTQAGSGTGSTRNLGAGGSTGTAVGANGAVSGGTGGSPMGGSPMGGSPTGGASTRRAMTGMTRTTNIKANANTARVAAKANAANATRAASNLRNAQNTGVSGYGSLERRRSSGDNINLLPPIDASRSASFQNGGATIADSHGSESHGGSTTHSVTTTRVDEDTNWSWLGWLGLSGLLPLLIPRRKHDVAVRSQTRIETR